MHSVTLNISDNAYNHLMYFISHIKNDIAILKDEIIKKDLKDITLSKETKSSKSLRGIFNSYADSSKIILENKAWQIHIMDKFKKDD